MWFKLNILFNFYFSFPDTRYKKAEQKIKQFKNQE